MDSKKSLWMFCHYAQQPPYNTMLRYHNWGKYIQREGYQATIVAASTVHNTSIDVVQKLNGSTESCADGVRYLYVPAPKYSGNGLDRVKNMLSFCMNLHRFKDRPQQPDYIVVCEAYLYPFVKRAYPHTPIITDIVDLWPLSIVAYTSKTNKNPLIRFLYRLEEHAYKKTDALVFSMEGGKDYLLEQSYVNKINLNKVFHVNMGCDLEYFDANHTSVDSDTGDRFVVTYSGSMRQANQIIQLCEAANILQTKGIAVEFRMYGNGPDEEAAKEYCKTHQLTNVTFFGRFTKSELPNILSSSTVNIMTYKKSNVMKYGGSQSKLFDYLASGKPIINCGDWAYDLVERHHCGLAVHDPTSTSIAGAIESLATMKREELQAMGNNARQTALMYSQPQMVARLIDVLHYLDRAKENA